jgi:signal transduction histidine kinase
LVTEGDIKDQLKSLLATEPIDYSRILELSSQLASYENGRIRFTVDAGVIDRLGQELVARQETAVSELVKNAYDADASVVDLIFENTDEANGTLTIDDNGHGMTKSQLINGFMRISSSDKIHNPFSPTFNRSRAGKKGIGRFATQRLGKKLTITTQTAESKSALQIVINWEDFNIDSDLIFISNSISEVPKRERAGTILIIENLREWWSTAAIKRVYRYSLDIIQPFPLSKKSESDETDPGFLVRCYRAINNNLEEVADEETMIFEHALAEIEGFVDSNGEAQWKVKSKKLNLEVASSIGKGKKDDAQKFDFLKNIHFKAYYFIYNIGMIPKLVEGYIREKANEMGGIRVYRNGFRVLPYGEQKDDWLGLDESVRRRVILPAHGKNNFFGFVEISDSSTKVFNELSSREGLFQNEALNELSDFVYRSLIAAVLRIAEARTKKQSTGQKHWVKEEALPSEAVKNIADELDIIADDYEKNNNSNQSSGGENGDAKNDTSERFRELSKRLRNAADTLEEIGMLRVLAGLGLTIGEFTHEIKQFLPAFDVDTDYLIENLPATTEAYIRATRLKNSFTSFSTYASYFDKTISQNAQRDLRPIELRDAVNSFAKIIMPDLERNAITLGVEFIGYDLFTCKMHPSEWASILFNLYSNSKKAIKRAKSVGSIYIKCGSFDDKLFLAFSDNGDGIPKGNEEQIFNAFFTTSPAKGQATDAQEELSGTGLGLKIVRDIIESYGGEIFLGGATPPFITCFRIELPKATEEEITKYDI